MTGWNRAHWSTALAAVAAAGLDQWLAHGGWSPTLGDAPVFALVVLVLRAMYLKPPGG